MRKEGGHGTQEQNCIGNHAPGNEDIVMELQQHKLILLKLAQTVLGYGTKEHMQCASDPEFCAPVHVLELPLIVKKYM